MQHCQVSKESFLSADVVHTVDIFCAQNTTGLWLQSGQPLVMLACQDRQSDVSELTSAVSKMQTAQCNSHAGRRKRLPWCTFH